MMEVSVLVELSVQGERLLDMKEFMSFMHCKRSSVYRWRKEGKIASVIVGRKVLFRATEVESFLQENTRCCVESNKEVSLCQ